VGAFRTQVREIPDDLDLNYAHVGIGGLTGPLYQLNRGHFVTMLRQPEQRLISMYNHYGPHPLFKDSLRQREWTYTSGVWDSLSLSSSSSPSLREYAEANAGCTVRQLTRDVLVPCETLPLPTLAEVSDAVHVLHDGFAFVGITEQWALSVCLFRKMFGGQCVASDLSNSRPGTNSSSFDYDTSELYGWVDALDGPVYTEALQMFEQTLNVYGVDVDTCTSFCQGQLD
jgi:hypothetical protein